MQLLRSRYWWWGALIGLVSLWPTWAAAANVGLTTKFSGTGSGSLACAANASKAGACASSYPSGTKLVLTATASADSAFVAFSGDCSGTACALTMGSAKTVSAQFDKKVVSHALKLSISGTGTGSVACAVNDAKAGSCAATYPAGTKLILSATASADSNFTAFSGDCSGTACALTMGSAKTVSAQFDKKVVVGAPKSFKVTGVVVGGSERFIQYRDVRFVFNWDSGSQPKSLRLVIDGEWKPGFGAGTVARFTARFSTMGTTVWQLYAGSTKIADGKVTLESAPAFEFKANPTYEKPAGVCSPQCVGFIKAHLDIVGSIPRAFNAWDSKLLSGLGYAAFANTVSTRAPRPGDILVWSSRLPPGGSGHVAIVKSVDQASNTMLIRDSNWDNHCGLSGDVSLLMSKDQAGIWTITDSSTSGRGIASYLLGWLSKDEAWPAN